MDISEIIRSEVIDSREIEERIDELESERSSLESDIEEAQEALDDAGDDEDGDTAELESALAAAKKALAEWDSENGDELTKLQAFRDEVEPYSDWKYGETLIQEEYWPEYVQDMLKDTGELPRDLPAYIEIDWNATAENIKADYSEAELEGQTFFFRCS